MTTKPKIGRPSRGFPERYQLRHSLAQMNLPERSGAWMRAAKLASMEIGDWIRDQCDRAAARAKR